MVILALDTTAPSGSVAVLRGDELLVVRALPAGVPHGRRLPGDILEALRAAGLGLAAIELYAVASGPGAFTGLRVGIATMQGFAFAHRRPVAAVPALEALVETATRSGADATYAAAWMDAARGEVFTALYEAGGGTTAPVSIDPPAVGAPGATLARWRPILRARPVIFIGDGALRYAALIRETMGAAAAFVEPTPPIAPAVGRLGLARAAAGDAGPPHAVRPLYVRRPDAELARDRRAGEIADRG